MIIDDGAAQALRRGGSLLPVGVTAVKGEFERGDSVCVVDPSGAEIARGLVNYRLSDLERILGQQSEAIVTILGYAYGDAVIHRDNMVIL